PEETGTGTTVPIKDENSDEEYEGSDESDNESDKESTKSEQKPEKEPENPKPEPENPEKKPPSEPDSSDSEPDPDPSDSDSDSDDDMSTKLKAKEPETFTGEGKDRSTEAVRNFKQAILDYLEIKGISNWETDQKALVFAGSYLKGAAKAWYEAQREEAKESNRTFTLRDLLDGLATLYIPSTDKSAEYAKWIYCKQTKDGIIRPVGEFASELEFLKATMPFTDKIPDWMQREQLMMGMTSKLQGEVRPHVKDTDSFKDIVTLAEHKDSMIRISLRKEKGGNKTY